MGEKIKKVLKIILLVISIILIILGVSFVFYIRKCIGDGEKFMHKGQYEESIQSFKKIINLYQVFGSSNDVKMFPTIYLNIGIAYKELKKYDEAKKSFEKIIELYKQNKFKEDETSKFILEEAKKNLDSIGNQ